QPLTMSENFTRIIQRIDFEKMSTMLKKDPSLGTKEFEVPEVQVNVASFVNPTQRTSFAQSTSTSTNFDSIKSKIMNALTNISVLHDVIKVTKEQEYLVMERVAKDPTKLIDEKPITVLVAKKRALSQAAQIISTAYERLQCEQNVQARTRIDF